MTDTANVSVIVLLIRKFMDKNKKIPGVRCNAAPYAVIHRELSYKGAKTKQSYVHPPAGDGKGNAACRRMGRYMQISNGNVGMSWLTRRRSLRVPKSLYYLIERAVKMKIRTELIRKHYEESTLQMDSEKTTSGSRQS